MTVRPMRGDEAAQAAELAGRIETAAHWPAAEYERLCRDAGEGSLSLCLLAEEPPGELAGLLAVSAVGPEAELTNLAVVPEKRRRGLASALLAEAIERLSRAGVRTIWLEVRESNQAAIAFYQHHGFQLAGRRRNYYQAPEEDALILNRTVTSDE